MLRMSIFARSLLETAACEQIVPLLLLLLYKNLFVCSS